MTNLQTTTDPTREAIKERILMLISKEKRNAITLGTLCSFLRLKPRMVKELITELRLEHPIVAKETEGGGYWIAEDAKDIQEFVDMIKRRRDGYERTIQVMIGHQVDVI